MPGRLNSIGIGLALVLVVGSVVYFTKQPAFLPTDNTTGTSSNTSGSFINKIINRFDDESDEENEGGGGQQGTVTNITPPTTQPSATGSNITLSQIAQHNSRSSCWSAINGSVYDLTSWIPNHPGGEQTILNICGRDGSNDYNGQHGGRSRPATILAGFKIGTLAK